MNDIYNQHDQHNHHYNNQYYYNNHYHHHHHELLEQKDEVVVEIDEQSTTKSIIMDFIFAGNLNHTLPGMLFILGGLFYLLLSLYRSIRMNRYRRRSNDVSFCDLYVPEPNYKLLRIISLFTLPLLLFALIRQGLWPCLHNHNHNHNNHSYIGCFIDQSGHIIMFITYGIVLLIVLLESSSTNSSFINLPVDTWRRAESICHFLNYVLLHHHAMMKATPVAQITHDLWSQLELYQCIMVSYSIYNTNDIFSYLSNWSLYIIKGIWIIITGIQLENANLITMENVYSIFILQIIIIAIIVTFIGAIFGTNSSRSSGNDINNKKINQSNDNSIDYERVHLSVDQADDADNDDNKLYLDEING